MAPTQVSGRGDWAVVAATDSRDDIERFIGVLPRAVGAGDEAGGKGDELVEIMPESGFAGRVSAGRVRREAESIWAVSGGEAMAAVNHRSSEPREQKVQCRK